MTVAEAARVLEVTPSVVYELCGKRLLGHHRVGTGRGVIRITPRDIDEYIARRRVEPVDAMPRERAADPPPVVRSFIREAWAREEEREARRAGR